MPRFAANLSMMYREVGFLDRFAAAAADRFRAVECQFPYGFAAERLAERLDAHRLRQVLINAPPGDHPAGERGIASLPGREDEFRRGFETQALPYAQRLGCPRIHVMAGLLPRGAERAHHQATYQRNLEWAAGAAASAGIEILIEPINLRDVPGYFLNRQDHAHQVVAAVGAPNLKVQMDLYHCQIVEGDLSAKLRQHLPTGKVGHLQIAGVPDRHEPDDGEVDYAYLFRLLDELGYSGWVGCEYSPRAGTSAGLRWLNAWREPPPD